MRNESIFVEIYIVARNMCEIWGMILSGKSNVDDDCYFTLETYDGVSTVYSTFSKVLFTYFLLLIYSDNLLSSGKAQFVCS